jgi:hypothetical protein
MTGNKGSKPGNQGAARQPAIVRAVQPKAQVPPARSPIAPSSNRSGAPPVYRPQAAQPKMASALPQTPRARQMAPRTSAPPVYRPENNRKAVQPYIAKGTVVYYPSTTTFATGQSKTNFERSLAVLGGPPRTARTARAVTWSDFARDQAGYELSVMGRPTGGTNQKKVKKKFEDKTKVYAYQTMDNVQTAKPTEYLLLSFDDMAEGDTGTLPTNVTDHSLDAAKCVIEVLSEWNINIPGGTTSTVKAWHDYSKSQGLDYRQDNHYIVIYVQKLGYPLISSVLTKWADWNPPNGRYIVTSTTSDTDRGAVGHMIGVTVAGGTKTITDTQELSPGTGSNPSNFDNFKVRYVFRVR